MTYQNLGDAAKATEREISGDSNVKAHQITHFKYVQGAVCQFYLNRTVKRYPEHSTVPCSFNPQFHISSFQVHSTPPTKAFQKSVFMVLVSPMNYI